MIRRCAHFLRVSLGLLAGFGCSTAKAAVIGSPASEVFSSAIQFSNGNPGSVIRSVTSKLKDATNVADFGCDTEGLVDASACLQNALNSLPSGGRLHVRGKLSINAADVIVPAGTGIYGDCITPGSINGNAGTDYALERCGAISLGSSHRIILQGSSSLQSLLIYRAGITFPAVNGMRSRFAGTAVTLAGDDAAVSQTTILGFNKAIYGSGVQRARLTDLDLDNTNGIEITNSADTDYITRVHQWPFASIVHGGSYTDNIRGGIAIYLHDLADWAKITDCFSYGYSKGIVIANANSVTITGSGADNVFSTHAVNPRSVGLEISGTSNDTRVIGFQAAAQDLAGVYVNLSDGKFVSFTDVAVWGGSTHGVLVDGGDVAIDGGVVGGLVSVEYGVSVSSAASRVSVRGVRFGTITKAAINPAVPTTTVYVSNNDFSPNVAHVGGANIRVPIVASGAIIAAPTTGDTFYVSGTAAVSKITNGWAMRGITLIFQDTNVVENGTGANAIRLNGAANDNVVAGSTLSLKYADGQWYETSRSE